MDLVLVILAACAAAFVISAVDYFVDIGIWRAALALALSLVVLIPLGGISYAGMVAALASSFLAMTFLSLIERVNYRPVGRYR